MTKEQLAEKEYPKGMNGNPNINILERDAFIKGYEANQSKWISVEDALPHENEEVNVYFETVIKRSQGDINESGVTSCIFTKNEHLRPLFAKDNGWVILGVTHWQYLPNKPI